MIDKQTKPSEYIRIALEALGPEAPECCGCSAEWEIAITALRQALEQAEKQEPVSTAWDEGYQAGINDERMSEANIGIAGFNAKVKPARNNPYRTHPQPKAEQEPVAWALEWSFNGDEVGRRLYDDETHCKFDADSDGGVCRPLVYGDTSPQPQKPLWIDPNDKTQAQFLPHIGEPILFCHNGKTYYGQHNGGSFQYGYGVTKRYYNTWECHWMYFPEAHNIKE